MKRIMKKGNILLIAVVLKCAFICVWLLIKLCTKCMSGAYGCQNRVLDSQELYIQIAVSYWCELWGPNLGPLQEQQVFLTSEISPQPPLTVILKALILWSKPFYWDRQSSYPIYWTLCRWSLFISDLFRAITLLLSMKKERLLICYFSHFYD